MAKVEEVPASTPTGPAPAAAAAAPAAAAPEPSKPINFLYGPNAGLSLKEGSNFNIFVGSNAGRNINMAEDCIVFGDNFFGPLGSASGLVEISDKVPVIPDSHVESMLLTMNRLLAALPQFKGHFNNAALTRLEVAIERAQRVYTSRMRCLDLEWRMASDRTYIKITAPEL